MKKADPGFIGVSLDEFNAVEQLLGEYHTLAWHAGNVAMVNRIADAMIALKKRRAQ